VTDTLFDTFSIACCPVITMHSGFAIPELFILILELLHADDRRGGASVASLARTCKLFIDPALDVLWRCQVNLVPLLRCLPDGVLVVKDFGPHWYRDFSSKIVCLRYK
jgi:hypothetical protein